MPQDDSGYQCPCHLSGNLLLDIGSHFCYEHIVESRGVLCRDTVDLHPLHGVYVEQSARQIRTALRGLFYCHIHPALGIPAAVSLSSVIAAERADRTACDLIGGIVDSLCLL